MDDREEEERDGSKLIQGKIKVEEAYTSDEEFLSCSSSPGNSEEKDPMYFSQFTSESMEETFRGAYHDADMKHLTCDDDRYETPVPTTISQSDAAILGLPLILNNSTATYFDPSLSSTSIMENNYSSTTQLTPLNNNHLYALTNSSESNNPFNNSSPMLCFNVPSSTNELTYLSPSIIQEYSYDESPKSNCDYEFSSLQVLTSLGETGGDNRSTDDCDFTFPTILLEPDESLNSKLIVPCQLKEPSPCSLDVCMDGGVDLPHLNLEGEDDLRDVFKTEMESELGSESTDEATVITENGSVSTEISENDIEDSSLSQGNSFIGTHTDNVDSNSFPFNVLSIKDELGVDDLYTHCCTVCPARFASQDDLEFHEQFHSNRGEGRGKKKKETLFKCRKCVESFKSEKSFNRHLERHLNPNYTPRKTRKDKTAKEAVTCNICGLDCVCPSRLRDHMRKHTGEKPYQCLICSKSFVTQPVLRRHAKEHEPHKPFPCTICNKTFAARANLLGHIRLHDRKRQVLCITCGKSYRNQTDLKIHERSHTGEKPYQCGVCGKAFVTNVVLRRHERGHAEHKPFPCPICPKSFAAAVDMRSHMRAHPIKDLPLQCYICSYECADSTELGQHIDSHSLGKKKRFQCEICGRTSRNQSEFDIHQRRHTGERPFKCNLCEKSFVTNVILRKHLRSHATVKPYQCEICPKSFAAMADMKSHMRSHPAKKLQESILKFNLELLGQYSAEMDKTKVVEDSGEKKKEEKVKGKEKSSSVSCSFCGKESTSASYMRAHEKSHATGKIRYCSQCGKMCSSYKTLIKHEKRAHKIDNQYQPPSNDDTTTENSYGDDSVASENSESENTTFPDQLLPHGIKSSLTDHKNSISVKITS